MYKLLKIVSIVSVIAVLIAGGGDAWYKRNFFIHNANPQAALNFKTTGKPVLDSIGKGVKFLTAYQGADGAFVEGKISTGVEFTALSLQALKKIPDDFLASQNEEYRKKLEQIIGKGIDFIKSRGPQSDGGIYTSLPRFSFGVYGTSVCLTALRELGISENDPIIQNAQKYLLSTRHNEKGLFKGGFGYNGSTRPDLSNTYNVLEALEASGLPKDDPAYKSALEFVTSCQNRSESNASGMALTDDGGFFYKPDLEGKGRREQSSITGRASDGRPIYASYGAMSYAGLISFLYADVDKSDGRVKSAWQWIQNHYNLKENVNRGQSGLYYYYRIMAKALDRYGQKVVRTADGKDHDWAQEMAQALMDAQQPDGAWFNTNKAFMEDDKILVTSFALGALELCYKNMR